MSKTIRETAALTASIASDSSDGLDIQIITPGWGSSGYYAESVLEAAADEKVFPAGTHMYFDHPTATERQELPERSTLRLGAVLREDATWDGTRLAAKADPIAPYRELLEDTVFQKAVGVSIVAAAEVSAGEQDGRTGPIIERLVPSNTTSVDFVTHAGRGGAFGAALESAQPSMVLESAVRRGVSEATVNDQRGALSNLLRDAYNADNTWVWLRDFDDTTAWFEVEDNDGAAVWQQAYTKSDDGLADALTGDRTEVRVSTQYVPVGPAGSTTQESKEDTMAITQIEESELSGLRETAGRVTTLEAERDTATKTAEEAVRRANVAEARLAAASVARARVVAENADLASATVDRVVAEALREVPLTENGELDTDALNERTDKAREAEESYLASLAANAGAGMPSGFGKSGSAATVTESDIDKAIAAATGRQIKEA